MAYRALVSLVQELNSIRNHPTLPISFDVKQITSLSQTVEFLIDFFNSEYYRFTTKAAQDLESRIASAAYAAENAIDFLAIDLIGGGSIPGQKVLNMDLQKAIENMELVKGETMQFKAQSGPKKAEQYTYSAPSASSEMVGFDDILLQLIDIVTGWHNQRLVVPVVGMGGMGKTTLAKSVYQHPYIVRHFDICLWATVSREYSAENILKQLLRIERESTAGGFISEFVEQLYKTLYGRRYLIVFDDMWSVDVWDKVRFCLPDNGNGSRVVVTTQASNLASSLSSSPILMNFLDEHKSWELFCRNAFGEEYCPVELEEIGKKILKICRGLPLSLVVIGGHFRRSSRAIEYWEKVYNHMKPISNLEGEEQCLEILSFSYEHLPTYLKPCLVYSGTFPEDERIRTSRLIQLWMAKGLLRPKKGLSLEEVGEDYLEDLIGRNLISLLETRWNGKVEYIAIHDVVREFCLKVAKNEEFVDVVKDTATRAIRRWNGKVERITHMREVSLKVAENEKLVRELSLKVAGNEKFVGVIEDRVVTRFGKKSEEFESTEETIIAALMNNFTYKVGIYGVGGIGKTRLARGIGERVASEELFKNVMMVMVGPNCYGAEDRIVFEIYDYLGMKWHGGDVVLAEASELLSELVKQGRVLIILDDVWGVVTLVGPGISKDSCKILIVSRFKKVCLDMGCNAIFRLMEGEDVAREKSSKSLVCKQMTVPPRHRRFILNQCIFLRIALTHLHKHSVNDELLELKHLRSLFLMNDHNLQTSGKEAYSAARSLQLLDPSRSPAPKVETHWKNLKILGLYRVDFILNYLSVPYFSKMEGLMISSCDTLKHLMPHSIAKNLLKLKYLTIKDCFMMEQVIAYDGEAENIHKSLFPRLRKLELIGLPSLKSFCDTMNDLELPSLEKLILDYCGRMTEFSGGKLNMPVLRWVEKDHTIYRIDAVNTVQRLFNDKYLFVHNFPSHSQDQEVEEFMDDPNFYPENSSQSSGDTSDDPLYDIEAENFWSISNQDTMIEENVADSQKTYFEKLAKDILESEVSIDKALDIKRYLTDFISFCSVLPRYYEFTKDILVSQWIVGGLVELGEDNMTEEVCAKCFDTLVDMDYFVPSEFDYIFDWMKYKVGDGEKIDSKMRNNTSEIEHVSLAFKELGDLKKYSHLQTLVLYDSYGLDHLPSDIFSKLQTLKILNLSGTNVSVLPSSIENLKELRFLDMSKTPIRWLPEAIGYFSHMHTLNLDGCLEIKRLPRCTNKLINLQHLVLDVCRLQSMPIGMGNLSNLQTLNAFSVGVDDGHSIRELKDLNKLRGSFSLLNLENVGSEEEASEASIYKKVGLRKIELHWGDTRDEKCESEEGILESLQPPLSTQELKLLFFSGGVLPSWICNPSFTELVSITLDECKYCSSLPSLGELPSLKNLSIIENNVLTEICSSFFRKQANQNRVAFPKLEKLSFDSMSKLEEWTGFEDGDFPSLQLLIVEYCPVFMGVPFLSRLRYLSGLEIRYCPEFSCLAEDSLPTSLESLMIKQSPKLKAQCCDDEWEDWPKVALVPSIYIDDQQFSPKNSESVLPS